MADESESRSADVMIIGAGAAELSAARALSSSDFSVIILETRDRIGGRIFTRHIPSFPAPIELGAEFIHGEPREIWDAVESAGLTVVEVTGKHWLSLEARSENRTSSSNGRPLSGRGRPVSKC